MFTATTEGYYEFRTTATDSANNKETKPITSEREVGYDSTTPSSSVNTTSYWVNTNITITVGAYDDISDIKNVTLWYRYSSDNVTWWEECIPFGVDENHPWEWVFNVPNGVGYYEFYSTANDNALNYKDYTITPEEVCAYDNITPPAPTSLLPSNDTWINTSTPTFNWSNVIDDTSGLANYTIQVDNNMDFSSPEYTATVAANSTISSVLTDGIYYWRVRAVDNASNAGDWSEIWIIKIDIFLPVAAIQTPAESSCFNSVPIWFNGTCSNGLSGINRVEINITYKESNTVVVPWTSTNLAINYTWWDYPFYPSAEASYTIRIRSVDNASNAQEILPIINI
ncbi:hypothetical protein FP804_04860, partial [archaeon]|nr:hypothetical protein [archaeon]